MGDGRGHATALARSACSFANASNVIDFSSRSRAAATKAGQYLTGIEPRSRIPAACSVETSIARPSFAGPPNAEKTSSIVCMVTYFTKGKEDCQHKLSSAKLYSRDMERQLAPRLDEPHQRLVWAREKAGFPEAIDAIRRFGWKESTYYTHESGTRGISKKAANRYARAYKVTPSWLLFGEDAMVPPVDPELVTLWDNLTPEMQRLAKRYLKMLADEQGEAA